MIQRLLSLKYPGHLSCALRSATATRRVQIYHQSCIQQPLWNPVSGAVRFASVTRVPGAAVMMLRDLYRESGQLISYKPRSSETLKDIARSAGLTSSQVTTLNDFLWVGICTGRGEQETIGILKTQYKHGGDLSDAILPRRWQKYEQDRKTIMKERMPPGYEGHYPRLTTLGKVDPDSLARAILSLGQDRRSLAIAASITEGAGVYSEIAMYYFTVAAELGNIHAARCLISTKTHWFLSHARKHDRISERNVDFAKTMIDKHIEGTKDPDWPLVATYLDMHYRGNALRKIGPHELSSMIKTLSQRIEANNFTEQGSYNLPGTPRPYTPHKYLFRLVGHCLYERRKDLPGYQLSELETIYNNMSSTLVSKYNDPDASLAFAVTHCSFADDFFRELVKTAELAQNIEVEEDFQRIIHAEWLSFLLLLRDITIQNSQFTSTEYTMMCTSLMNTANWHLISSQPSSTPWFLGRAMAALAIIRRIFGEEMIDKFLTDLPVMKFETENMNPRMEEWKKKLRRRAADSKVSTRSTADQGRNIQIEDSHLKRFADGDEVVRQLKQILW